MAGFRSDQRPLSVRRLAAFISELICAAQRCRGTRNLPSGGRTDAKGVARYDHAVRSTADRFRRELRVALAGIAALVGIAAATSTTSPGAKAPAKPIKLQDSTMIVEVNDTDGDAGIQPFLDGEPWTRMAIQAPDGPPDPRRRCRGEAEQVRPHRALRREPRARVRRGASGEVQEALPRGEVQVQGRDGRGPQSGRYSPKLSHDIPDGPEITAPTKGATLSDGNAVARWTPGSQPAGVRDRRLRGDRRARAPAARVQRRPPGFADERDDPTTSSSSPGSSTRLKSWRSRRAANQDDHGSPVQREPVAGGPPGPRAHAAEGREPVSWHAAHSASQMAGISAPDQPFSERSAQSPGVGPLFNAAASCASARR